MELALFVYAANTVGSIIGSLFFCIIILSIIYGIWAICAFDGGAHKPPKWIPWTLAGMIAAATVLPSERTMWMMAGAYGTQSVVQSDVGKKTLLLIEKKLDAELEKLMSNSKK